MGDEGNFLGDIFCVHFLPDYILTFKIFIIGIKLPFKEIHFLFYGNKPKYEENSRSLDKHSSVFHNKKNSTN